MWGGGQGRGKCGGVGKGCQLKIKRAILKVCVFWCSIRYMRMQVYKKNSWHKFSRIAVSSYFVSHDYSTSTMVQEAYCSVCTFTAYFFLSQFSFIFHTPVLLFLHSPVFFLHSSFHSSVFFFMFVSMIEVEGERRKVSFTKALNGVDVKFFFSILFTDKQFWCIC